MDDAPLAVAQVVGRADLLYTVSGEPLGNAVVIAGSGGTIEWVDPADETNLPDGVEVLEVAVVTLAWSLRTPSSVFPAP